MKRERSWTRQQYDRIYRTLRRGSSWEYRDNMGVPNEVVRAAQYAFEAYVYKLHGWSSDNRYKRYLHIRRRIDASRELPF